MTFLRVNRVLSKKQEEEVWPALRSLQEMEIHYGSGTGVTSEAAGRPLPYLVLVKEYELP